MLTRRRDGGAPRACADSRFSPFSFYEFIGKAAIIDAEFSIILEQTSRVITAVESPNPHLGWHSRGYLPHWDHPGMIQSLNFRLADSLPSSVLAKMEAELSQESRANVMWNCVVALKNTWTLAMVNVGSECQPWRR